MIIRLLKQHRLWLLYGVCMSALLFLLQWIQWRFLLTDHSWEIYIGMLALLFTLLGAWISRQLARPKIQTIIVEKEIPVPAMEEFRLNETELKKLQLTPREWDVLQLIAQGRSNAEIADRLCLSLSTIKTHASNLFVKMDVKSRAQAIEKAKRLKITP